MLDIGVGKFAYADASFPYPACLVTRLPACKIHAMGVASITLHPLVIETTGGQYVGV